MMIELGNIAAFSLNIKSFLVAIRLEQAAGAEKSLGIKSSIA